MKKIIDLLRENARMDISRIAAETGLGEAEVAAKISEMEKSGVIRGYKVILNEDVLPDAKVKALIEVKVTPSRDCGFDAVARRIAKFPEVTDLFLLSGGYDLLLTVSGDSLQSVANFVASKLATLDGVISTSTSFQLRRYKESGKMMESDENYERLKISF